MAKWQDCIKAILSFCDPAILKFPSAFVECGDERVDLLAEL